jgi:hypothetical protein
MDASHSERRTPTFRQFAMVMGAVTWFALLLPVGARAAGQLVTLVDPVTEGKARVVAPGALRVAEFNDPGRSPYTRIVKTGWLQGHSFNDVVVATVPSGYRLVIDTVSFYVGVPESQRPIKTYIEASSGRFYIPIFFTGTLGQTWYQGTQRVQLYADPEAQVVAGFSRNSAASGGFVDISISGHLVKL